MDIVLPRDMPLREAHDIGESLTLELEKAVDGVERAFVHLDFESTHSPMIEHRYDALRDNKLLKKSRPMQLTRNSTLVASLLEEDDTTMQSRPSTEDIVV